MFQKLARVVIVCASLVIVFNKTVVSGNLSGIHASPRAARTGENAYIVNQLPSRRA
ncbi:MAG TPA: hypothetical protein VMU36_02780 [Spirochaetia bacterium]|nr:hypothetical protein [Spirochaetia bacterium]